MATQQQKTGKPWSGTNKIPNIKEFVTNLDKEKAERDKAIDGQGVGQQQQADFSEVTTHQNEKPQKGGKTVTDPVTGKQVVIADVGKEYMARADNPQVKAPSSSFLKAESVDLLVVVCPQCQPRQTYYSCDGRVSEESRVQKEPR